MKALYHKGLEKRWRNFSFEFQVANIDSEVYRSLRYQGEDRFRGAYARALELFDLTIEDAEKKHHWEHLREIKHAHEEFCDYFNGNFFHTDPDKMQQYYDDYALLVNNDKQRWYPSRP